MKKPAKRRRTVEERAERILAARKQQQVKQVDLFQDRILMVDGKPTVYKGRSIFDR